MVDMNVVVNASSENRNRMHVLPTPESPISNSLNNRSYVFLAMVARAESRRGGTSCNNRSRPSLHFVCERSAIRRAHTGGTAWNRHGLRRSKYQRKSVGQARDRFCGVTRGEEGGGRELLRRTSALFSSSACGAATIIVASLRIGIPRATDAGNNVRTIGADAVGAVSTVARQVQ